jgi:chorismate synthase
MLRYWTAGESHGKALIALVDGFPAGVTVDVEPIKSSCGDGAATAAVDGADRADTVDIRSGI